MGFPPACPAPRRELLVATAVAGAVAAALLLAGPAPGDAPAHLYRTLLLHDGSFLWDNLWYAGQYPFASYSLLYYLPAAAVGNLPLAFASVLVSAALFVTIGFHEWGPIARWPARAFALLAAAPLFTGLYSYSLGFMTTLAALRLFQRGRAVPAMVLAALTLGFSPLAFVFLCLVLLAATVARRRITRRRIAVAVALAAIAGVQGVVLVLFPSTGVYPFNHWDLLAVVGVCALGALLARRLDHPRLFVAFFVLWGVGCVAAFAVPSAIGDNVTRLRGFVFPIMLLVAAQARFRPRLLAAVALAAALAYNLVPYAMLVPYRLDSRPARAGFWQPALGFLGSHRDPGYRIEVVPTAAHWESYWLPRAGYALARGWYRQLDISENPVFYRGHLTASAYEQWLHRMGIRFVLLPHTKLDPLGGPAEARLLRDPALGLRTVFSSATWTIYEVPHATQLLTGGSQARITSLTHDAVVGRVGRPGSYLLRLRYSPYWVARPVGTCVRSTAGGMTRVTVRRGGTFSLVMPHKLDAVVDAVVDGGAADCN